MNANVRQKSLELRILEVLRPRMKLAGEDELRYLSLTKGYEGEIFFDNVMDNYSKDWLVLKNLLFEMNHSLFQVDTLVIYHDLIHLFDVKNFEGDFFIEGDKWYSANKKEVTNPLHQLQRCERLFLRLLHESNCYLPIQSYLPFVNPEFYLYQARLNQPFIFLPQLKRFLSKLCSRPVKLQKSHFALAEKLLALNIENYRNMKLPIYTFEMLRKGIICERCHQFVELLNDKMVICRHCGKIEGIHPAVLRSVEEFRLLFPEEKVTTKAVFEWCNGTASERIIQKDLKESYRICGKSKGVYYV